jgi:hypothetical protein
VDWAGSSVLSGSCPGFEIFDQIRFGFRRQLPDFSCIGQCIHRHSNREYSSDGVVDSTGAVFDSIHFLMVGVICNDWPSWCYALSHKCFSLEFIGVTNEDLLQDITETFSDVKVFLVCHEITEWSSG